MIGIICSILAFFIGWYVLSNLLGAVLSTGGVVAFVIVVILLYKLFR